MEITSNLNSSMFLDEVNLLRKQKGQYLCANFCNQLENVSHKITEIMYKNFGFTKRVVSDQHPCPEGISNNLIDLCLECIEIDLQKLQFANHESQALDSQVLRILIDVSEDLQTLVSYVKVTISSDRQSK